jgi:hypothetical protein
VVGDLLGEGVLARLDDRRAVRPVGDRLLAEDGRELVRVQI